MILASNMPVNTDALWLPKPIAGGPYWEIEVAPEWEAHEDSECWSFTKSEDGAFQISAAVKKAGAVLREELDGLAF